MYKDDCLKKTTKFTNSFMIWGCMSGKLPGEMAILTSTVNAQVYIEILDTFLIPSIEKNKRRSNKVLCVLVDDSIFFSSS
uniref:Uncharacterized protein n=1 Tax=Sinocyclocheilus rhinocerous TaxID=307959 RepID=A0A673J1W8_9TELE